MPIKNTKDIANMPANYKAFKQRLPRFVGVLAVNFFKENFTRQGFAHEPFVKWKERKIYIKDKKGARSILIKTGALRRSIRIIQTSQNKVQVGTMLPYAQIHNQGGTITQTPTAKQRKFFWAMYKQTNNEMFLRSAKAKQITITIPPRQFIGNSAGLNKRITRQIQAQLTQILLTQ